MNLSVEKKQTLRHRQQACGCQKERKKVRDGGEIVLRFKMDYNKVLPHISQNDHH